LSFGESITNFQGLTHTTGISNRGESLVWREKVTAVEVETDPRIIK